MFKYTHKLVYLRYTFLRLIQKTNILFNFNLFKKLKERGE